MVNDFCNLAAEFGVDFAVLALWQGVFTVRNNISLKVSVVGFFDMPHIPQCQ